MIIINTEKVLSKELKISARKICGELNIEIEYYINFKNISQVDIYNLTIPITIPKGTNLITESVYVNNREYLDISNKVLKFPVFKINHVLDIKYRVEILCKSKDVINQVNLNYFENKYGGEIKQIDSDKIVTKLENNIIPVNKGIIVKKQCNEDSCMAGDIIEYKIDIRNAGDTIYDNLVFKEEHSCNSEFVKGSFKIGDKSVNNADIYSGVYIGSVNELGDFYITYKLKVNDYSENGYINNKSYLSYLEQKENKEKIYGIVHVECNGIKIVNSILREIIDNNEIYSIKKDENIHHAIKLENIGNINLKNIRIELDKPEDLDIREVKLNDKVVDLNAISNNTLKIENINKKEKFKIEVCLYLEKENLNKSFEISGKVTYEEHNIENNHVIEGIILLNPKKYKLVDVNFEITFIGEKQCFTTEEEIESIIKIINTGNVELYNIEMIKESSNCVEILEKNKINNRVKPNDISIVPIILNTRGYYEEGIINFSIGFRAKYKINGEEKIIEKTKDNIEVEILKEDVTCYLSSNKEIFIVGEKAYFNIKIINKGNHRFQDIFLKLNIPKEIEILDSIIYTKDKNYKYLKSIDGLNLGTIPSHEEILIKNCVLIKDISINRKFEINYSIYGYYNIRNSNERIYREYKSEVLSSNMEKISIKSYFATNREVLINGQDIKYSTTLINDGTLPVNIIYKVQHSAELEEVKELNILEEEGSETSKKLILIEPNDGVVIENLFKYKNFMGVNTIYSQGIIGIYYEILDGTNDGYKELRTEALQTNITNTAFEELCIEETIDITTINPPIKEIINIYLNPAIVNNSIRDNRRDYNFNSNCIMGYNVDFIGKLNYTIEYLSYDEEEIHLISDERVFSSSIVLPNNFMYGQCVQIKPKVMDMSHKIIDNSIFINIDLLINTSM